MYAAAGAYTVTLVVSDGVVSSVPAGTTATVEELAGRVTVYEVVPGSVQAGTTVEVTITGTGFKERASVKFENGKSKPPRATNVVVIDNKTIRATVTTKRRRGTDSVWDVRVTNPNGSTGVLVDGLKVTGR